jgi:hypothetical protein
MNPTRLLHLADLHMGMEMPAWIRLRGSMGG